MIPPVPEVTLSPFAPSSGAEVAAAYGLSGVAHVPFPPPVRPDPSRWTPAHARRAAEWSECHAEPARRDGRACSCCGGRL